MRILAWIEAASVTGPAKNLLEFGQLGRQFGVELNLATFRREGCSTNDDTFLRAAAAAGIHVSVLHESGPWDMRVVRGMRDLAEKIQPDIVQTHGNKSHLLMYLSRLGRRWPWVAFHHGYTRPTRKQQIYDLADFWSLPKAAMVITVTQAFERELRAVGVPAERIRILPNAVDFERMQEVWQPGKRGATYTVVSVGRLSLEKGHADLLEAAAIVMREAGEPVALQIAGEGPERNRLEALARQRGISLKLTGQVADVRPVLAAGDVFALPSHSEGSPNALLEAMAAGMPSVATAVGGVPETITDKVDGLLVEAANPARMAQALRWVLDNQQEAERMGAAARTRMERDFSPASRTKALFEHYRTVLRN